MAHGDTASLPDKLRLVDGELICADGSNVHDYLRNFAVSANIDSETPVVLMRRDSHESDRNAAFMLRNWAS